MLNVLVSAVLVSSGTPAPPPVLWYPALWSRPATVEQVIPGPVKQPELAMFVVVRER